MKQNIAMRGVKKSSNKVSAPQMKKNKFSFSGSMAEKFQSLKKKKGLTK
jgi:hypothetical protein